jgi:hypothetical protein
MRSSNRSTFAAILAATLLSAGAAPAQDAFSITGTFKMHELWPYVGADLEGVYNNGNDHWWRLTLNGVSYAHEHHFDPFENGGFYERYITRLHADSFTFEFFGPDAATLDAVVSGQLAGGSLAGGAFLELANGTYYDPENWWYNGPIAYWNIGLASADPAGVSFFSYAYANQFTTDESGYPLVEPQRLYSEESWISDYRDGNNGALSSYYDLVDLGSDGQPEPPPPPLQLDAQDAAAVEGDKGATALLMTVTLNRESGQAVTVNYQTVNGTAAAPKDYTAKSGTLTFQPGEISKTISLSIRGDRQRESNETFSVRLSNPIGASLGRSVGTATIVNDD